MAVKDIQKLAIRSIKSEGIGLIIFIVIIIPTPIRVRPNKNPNVIIEIRIIFYKKIKESEKLIPETNIPKE